MTLGTLWGDGMRCYLRAFVLACSFCVWIFVLSGVARPASTGFVWIFVVSGSSTSSIRRNLNYRSVHACSVWSVVSRSPFLRPIDYGPCFHDHCKFLRPTIFEQFHEQSLKHCLGPLAGIICIVNCFMTLVCAGPFGGDPRR